MPSVKFYSGWHFTVKTKEEDNKGMSRTNIPYIPKRSYYANTRIFSNKIPMSPPKGRTYFRPADEENADAQRRLTHMETEVFGDDVKEQTEE